MESATRDQDRAFRTLGVEAKRNPRGVSGVGGRGGSP